METCQRLILGAHPVLAAIAAQIAQEKVQQKRLAFAKRTGHRHHTHFFHAGFRMIEYGLQVLLIQFKLVLLGDVHNLNRTAAARAAHRASACVHACIQVTAAACRRNSS